MNRKLVVGVGIVTVALLVTGAVLYWKAQAASTPDVLRASGTIESDTLALASEVPGRIAALNVDEGDNVKAGDVLAQLDTAVVDGQNAQAQATLEFAQANLARVKAGARAEQIRGARAVVAQAIAARDGAKQAWLDAQKARDNPQELDAQLDAARTALAVAEAQLKQSVALAGAADEGQNAAQHAFDIASEPFGYTVQTPGGPIVGTFNPTSQLKSSVNTQLGLAGAQDWIAWSGVQAATTQRDAAQASLGNLLAIRANPLEANARVNNAFAQYQAAEGALQTAQAKLAGLKAGPTKEQIAAAESQVAEAQAALRTLQVQREKMTLVAPRAGYIVARWASTGELTMPNAPILQLADLDSLTLTVYLPTSELGEVKVGDPARVTVDTFSNRAFDGKVVFISPSAEFTPRNVQTQAERVNLVYAIKISLPNPDHSLKPGMGADAEFRAGVDSSIAERSRP